MSHDLILIHSFLDLQQCSYPAASEPPSHIEQ